jgi:hypothetical protein
VTKIEVSRAPTSPKTALLIDFAILEPGDGVGVEILVEGNSAADLDVKGVAEGAGSIRTEESAKRKSFLWGYLWGLFQVVALLAAMGAMLLVVAAAAAGAEALKGRIPERLRPRVSRLGKVISAGIGALFVVFIFVMLFVLFPLQEANKQIGKRLLDKIPQVLRGHS